VDNSSETRCPVDKSGKEVLLKSSLIGNESAQLKLSEISDGFSKNGENLCLQPDSEGFDDDFSKNVNICV
jgi:hypothetical protein